MKQPCTLGFRCRYHKFSEDYDDLCIYPDEKVDYDKPYGFADDWICCPLVKCDSPLGAYLLGYDELNRRGTE